MVEALLGGAADATIRNAKGWAAVHSAAAAGHLEVVLRLVAAGAAPRSRPELDVLRMLTRKTTYRCGACMSSVASSGRPRMFTGRPAVRRARPVQAPCAATPLVTALRCHRGVMHQRVWDARTPCWASNPASALERQGASVMGSCQGIQEQDLGVRCRADLGPCHTCAGTATWRGGCGWQRRSGSV